MDINKVSKILKIVAGVISVIGVFFLVRIIMIGDETLETDVDKQSIISWFVSFSTFLLIGVTVVTLLLSIRNLFKHPKALKKTMMSLGILLVLLVIMYFTASGDEIKDTFGDIIPIKDMSGKILVGSEAASVSKWVSALINFTGLLGITGLVIIGYGFVKGLFK